MKIIRRLIIVICLCVFAYSAFQLGKIFYTYYKIDKDTSSMVEEYVEQPASIKSFNPLDMKIDFKNLLERNTDVAGWLYIPDTNINEAILKGETNDTYLRSDIDHNYNYAGSLFIEANNSKDLKDVNTTIYGHNMKNGSRFHDIRYFINEGKEYMEEHPFIYIYLPDGSVNIYEVIAAGSIDEDSSVYQISNNYDDYVKKMLEISTYSKDFDDEESPIIMLSTCHSSAETKRYVVWAKYKENLK